MGACEGVSEGMLWRVHLRTGLEQRGGCIWGFLRDDLEGRFGSELGGF